jgi:hypothetical protein
MGTFLLIVGVAASSAPLPPALETLQAALQAVITVEVRVYPVLLRGESRGEQLESSNPSGMIEEDDEV